MSAEWHRVNDTEWILREEDGFTFARLRKLGRYWHEARISLRRRSLEDAKRQTEEQALRQRIERELAGR